MKKILILIFLSGAFAGCKDADVELIFDALPEERMSERLEQLQTKLVESEYGWNAAVSTSDGPSYGFYVNFNEDQTLTMLSDISSATASSNSESTYRVMWSMNASLVFDTYNYITLLQDPTYGVIAGNTQGSGLQSDIEFEYVRIHQDSIILKGKKYGNTLRLSKATQQQKQIYDDQQYQSSIDETNSFFASGYSKFTTENGENVEIWLEDSSKKITFFTKVDGNISFSGTTFGFMADGLLFVDELSFLGVNYLGIGLEDDGNYYLYDNNGNKFIINASSTSELTFNDLFGSYIEGGLLPGYYKYAANLPMTTWSSSYATAWNNFRNQILTGSYRLTLGDASYIFDVVNKKLYVIMGVYQLPNTYEYICTFSYNYSINSNNEFTFSGFTSVDANAGLIANNMNSNFNTRFVADRFILTLSSDPYFGKCIKFTSVDTPTYFFTKKILTY